MEQEVVEEYVTEEIAGDKDPRDEEISEEIDNGIGGTADEADADVEDTESTNQGNRMKRRRHRSRRKSQNEVSHSSFLWPSIDCR